MLAGEGYLKFAGIVARAVEVEGAPDVRGQVDELLVTRVLRRGVVLDCAECERPAFVHVDTLAQRNICPRGGTANEFAQSRWRHPPEEPVWFYDLHPAARELLQQNGEVPLLLSSYLHGRHRHYVDLAEIDATHAGTARRIGEVDLLATCGDDVVTAEAKSTESFGKTRKERREAAGKRVALADLLRADQILLATTQVEWSPSSVDAIRASINEYKWRAGRPALRLLSGLGTDRVVDNRADVQSGARTPW